MTQQTMEFKLFSNAICDRICQIKDGYIVIDSYVADYDECGQMFELRCKNGWVGWSWMLEDEIERQKTELYDDIVANGVDINEKNIKYSGKIVYPLIFTPLNI